MLVDGERNAHDAICNDPQETIVDATSRDRLGTKAIDALSTGLALLDRRIQVLFANATAKRILTMPSLFKTMAPLPLALKLARPWIERGAIAVFPRGESARDQIAALPEANDYAIEALPSVVTRKAAILRIRRS